MEATRFVVGGTENPFDHYPSHHRCISVELVLVDRSCERTVPILYVLKHDLSTPSMDPRDAFALLGPILDMNRDRKEICLSDSTLVSYRSLITFTGPKSGHYQVSAGEDFCPGAILAMIDAIRCDPLRQSAILTSAPDHVPKKLLLKPLAIKRLEDRVDLDHWLPHPSLTVNLHCFSNQWGQIQKKLYEVRL